MTVLDRAVAIELRARHQATSDLIAALERAMRHNPEDGEDPDDFVAQVDEIVGSQGLIAFKEQRDLLDNLMTEILRNYNGFAYERGLEVRRRDHKTVATANEQWHESHQAIHFRDEQPRAWTTHRIDHCGAGEYVVRIDGVEVWREKAADARLTAAVEQAAAKQFLETYGPS
ncbi:hypothetical protein [Mycobacterium marinum]|uniref:hypothetical protein n=1 Tax=Mycobacterium marinum TaxID=1781 RepID=UPI002359719A|nr:hypothetical protein [Mycobacterium marinum]MDC9004102.1 hypothetical protein [Mycobacterium marinum]